MATKKYLLIILTICALYFQGCSTDADSVQPDETIDQEMTVDASDDETTDDTSETETETETSSEESEPLTTSLRTYIFGHSLIVHDPPLIPTPSNETTVPHWMAELSTVVNYEYAVSGQYGFLPQHANLPPIAQWGFDRAAGAWESDTEAFSEANFNSILLTAGNFIQYQPATSAYDGDNPENITPIGATLEIFDWVHGQEPAASIYIYENWPDMAEFLSNDIPASLSEFEAYNAYTMGAFHDWWIAYQTEVHNQRPELNVKMIPVGPIISKLLTETNLSEIEFSELYEDNAPHGRPTIYFMASLITYMAMYGEKAPSNFEVPDTVNSLVRTNYSATVDFIWNELNAFNDAQGNSLVFF